MRLHFFTVNDIEDYRKNYRFAGEAHDVKKKSSARTKDEFDQEFFYYFLKKMYNATQENFDSEIYGETGIDGLRLDFNFGLRLDVPEGNFRVKVSDFDSGQIFFDKYISGGRLISVEQYFIRWHVEIFLDGEKIFSHTLDLEGQSVVVTCKSTILGDVLAFLPYFEEFKKVHRCELSVCLSKIFHELFARLYPEINLVDEINFETYATYRLITLLSPFPLTPADYRKVSMFRTGGLLLGMDYLPPKKNFQADGTARNQRALRLHFSSGEFCSKKLAVAGRLGYRRRLFKKFRLSRLLH